MIVGFIFKIDQPLLCLSVDLHRHYDRAGIDLIRILLIVQQAGLLQFSGSHGRQVHQAYELILPVPVHLLPVFQILPERCLDRLAVVAIIKRHILQLCGECGVTAVIRPVGVEHPDLCHSRIPVLLPGIVLSDEMKITVCHGQSQRIIQFPELVFFHDSESVKCPDILRLVKLLFQCLRLLKTCKSGIYRIVAVLFDCLHLFIRDSAFQHIDCGSPDQDLFIFIQETDTLDCGICPLIKLARQILNRKDSVFFLLFKCFLIEDVYRRLCKDTCLSLFIDSIRDILHVVTYQDPDLCQSADLKVTPDLVSKILRGSCKCVLLLYINTAYFIH